MTLLTVPANALVIIRRSFSCSCQATLVRSSPYTRPFCSIILAIASTQGENALFNLISSRSNILDFSVTPLHNVFETFIFSAAASASLIMVCAFSTFSSALKDAFKAEPKTAGPTIAARGVAERPIPIAEPAIPIEPAARPTSPIDRRPPATDKAPGTSPKQPLAASAIADPAAALATPAPTPLAKVSIP